MIEFDLPLDFSLHDANDEPVLLLGGTRRLTLAIQNTSPTPLFLNPLKDAHHFALRFRAGVLSEYQKIDAGRANKNDWVVTTQQEHGDVLVHVRHKTKDGMNWARRQTLELMLEGLQGAGNTRATRVELVYQHIRREGKAGKLLDHRPRHHQFVLTRLPAQAHPPLEAHFVGRTGNLVLNDGAYKNTIVLQLTASTPLTLKAGTRLFLHLPAGKEEDAAGALATGEQLQRIELKATIGGTQSLTAVRADQPRAVEWEITAQPDATIAPPGFLTIELSGLVTAHRNGPSIVRVRWQELGKSQDDDYADGEVIATLQKSPLVVVKEAAGIGTFPGPGMELDSETMRALAAETTSAMWAFVGRSVGGNLISYRTASYPPCENWPCIRLTSQNFPLQWPGVKQDRIPFTSLLAGRVSVWMISDQDQRYLSIFLGKLRDRLNWFEGVKSYMDQMTPPQDRAGDYSAMFKRTRDAYEIPLKPNTTLYARIDTQNPPGWYEPEVGKTANARQFSLFFEDEHDWFRTDAVALARWDEAGVRLCDGTVHACALPMAVPGPLALGVQNETVSANWDGSPGSPVVRSPAYELKLKAADIEHIYPDLKTTSVQLDVSKLAEGMYTGSVRGVVDGMNTGWCVSEDVLPIFHSAQSMARGLRTTERTARQAALEIWKCRYPPISVTDMHTALVEAGYAESDVTLAVDSKISPLCRHVGPAGSPPSSRSEVLPFDDEAGVMALNGPLTRIDIHGTLHRDGIPLPKHIVGIQAFYGADKALPLHGCEGERTVIPVVADDPIIEVSGSFGPLAQRSANNHLCELTLHYRSRVLKFGSPPAPYSYPFALQAGPGEAVVGFFGSVVVSSQNGLCALGILTKRTAPLS